MGWLRWSGLLVVLALLSGCSAPPTVTRSTTTGPRIELNVFAAASLTDAFKAIGKNFEASNPGARVVFNFAGSQQLVRQIEAGAPVDVFAPANQQQMEALVESGQVAGGTPRAFVRNRLVVIYAKDNPAGFKELKDLARPGLKLDLAAPTVPAGQYALDFLDKAARDPAFGAGFKDAALKNVVSYEENVKAVLSKVTLGEADAGIVYTSDIAGAAGGKVGRFDLPARLNMVATYPIAPITTSKHPDLAQKFISYALSPDAQAILARYGFMPAAASAGGSGAGGT